MRRIGLLTLWGVLLAVEVSAIIGHEWKQWSLEGRTTYVMGVTDTWQNVETVRRAGNRPAADNEPHEASSIFTPLINCMRQRMTYIQITATVDKYLENNPSQWHYDMASLVWTAMNEACTAMEEKGK
jgi:Ssp1 endopeptidase immunity protein Rap1a